MGIPVEMAEGAFVCTPTGDALRLSSGIPDGGCVQHSVGLVSAFNVGAGAAVGSSAGHGSEFGFDVGVGCMGADGALGAGSGMGR